MLLAILSVEPPNEPPNNEYTPLEMETNLDVMQKISLDAYLIKKDDLQRINRIEIKPPLAEGESYIAGMKYTFSYIVYDQNNNPIGTCWCELVCPWRFSNDRLKGKLHSEVSRYSYNWDNPRTK